MDRRDYIWDFEDFLQENVEQHKMYPSDMVWAGIHRSMHPKPRFTYLYITVIFIGLGIAGKIFDGSMIHEQKQFAEATIVVQAADHFDLPFYPPVKEQRSAIAKPIEAKPVLPTMAVTAEEVVEAKTINIATTENMNAVDKASDQLIVAPTLDETLTEETIAEATMHMAAVNRISSKNRNPFQSFNTRSISEELKKLPRSNKLKLGWQLYISPNVSYRELSGKGLPYYTSSNLNSVFPTPDVKSSVTHKPAFGFEMGGAITYAVTNRIRLKAGLQFTVNRYEVQAFHSVPEVAPMTSNSGSGSFTVVSTFRNYNGFSKTWLKNQHILMSIPVGAELTLFGNENIQFKIAGTLQPTLVVNNQAYMISTNMKNYAKAPSLYKDLNLAAGAEAFISVKGKSLRYNIGPQFRYQLFSSYKKPYPISEFLTDYGLKLSIGR